MADGVLSGFGSSLHHMHLVQDTATSSLHVWLQSIDCALIVFLRLSEIDCQCLPN
jgi:hypothetical protein